REGDQVDRRIVSVGVAPLRDVNRVTGFVAALRDMTDERERAQALQRSEARYHNLVESASDAIFTVDASGRFTSVNRALEEATGKAREELIGAQIVVLSDPRDLHALEEMLAATFLGRRQRREARYIDGNGATRMASVLTSPVFENGVVTGALGVVR